MEKAPRPDIPELDKDGTIKWEGYLNKKRAVVPAIRNRYVVLRGTKFTYYASHEDPDNNRVPLGIHDIIDWEEWDGKITFAQPMLHGFKIKCADKTEVYLGAPNRQDYETWLNVLAGVINPESSGGIEIKKQWKKEKKRRKEEKRQIQEKEEAMQRLEDEQQAKDEQDREEALKLQESTAERRAKFEKDQEEKKKRKEEEKRSGKRVGKSRRKSQALGKQKSSKKLGESSGHEASASTGSGVSDAAPAPAPERKQQVAPAPAPAPLPPPPSGGGVPPPNPMRNALMDSIRKA